MLDLTKKMIEMSGKDVEIVFTGQWRGDKLHECLFSGEERVGSPLHPHGSHAQLDSVESGNLNFAGRLGRSGAAQQGDDSGWRQRTLEQHVFDRPQMQLAA